MTLPRRTNSRNPLNTRLIVAAQWRPSGMPRRIWRPNRASAQEELEVLELDDAGLESGFDDDSAFDDDSDLAGDDDRESVR